MFTKEINGILVGCITESLGETREIEDQYIKFGYYSKLETILNLEPIHCYANCDMDCINEIDDVLFVVENDIEIFELITKLTSLAYTSGMNNIVDILNDADNE